MLAEAVTQPGMFDCRREGATNSGNLVHFHCDLSKKIQQTG